ncbi:MAG TPA: RNA polymerase sigma factor [Bacteroidota bacterium]|jgi:RNA polymerase sigma-70 factor (ECF subfamily)|nr:RNA polymerase sigma factor [Bacteroidota bacterium]
MDESAFASFYESTKRQLWLYIVRVVGDASVADDLFQETYLRFLQHTLRESDEKAVKSYLYRIATNLANDHWRKLKRHRTWFGADQDDTPQVTDPRNPDLRHDVGAALRQLSARQRSLLWLAYVEDYGHKEIAGMLKLREGSIKVLLFRARQKLSEVLRHMGISPEATP